mgnify:CR=1 FL=1
MHKVHEVRFATQNSSKFNSLSDVLVKHDIELVHYKVEFQEPRSDDLEEIARSKIYFAYEQIGKPCIVHDTGFYIHSLGGFPKTFVNFVLETIGTDGILKLVKGKTRECEFMNCLAYLDEILQGPIYFKSSVKGALAETPRGRAKEYDWSELSLIFIPEGQNKTLGEMNSTEREFWRENLYKDPDNFATKFSSWFLRRY